MIANIMIRSAATNNSANILPFGGEIYMENSAAVFIVALLFSEYPVSLILETQGIVNRFLT
jgi:hypothetical protein